MPALLPVLADSDVFVAFSARRALRRIDDWRAAALGLDSSDPKVREGMLLAMEQQYDVAALDTLIAFAESPRRPIDERIKAVRFLAEVHRKAPPWDGKWWGTQPAKREPPARTIAWEGTPKVLDAARRLLLDPSGRIRIAAIDALAEAKDQDSRALIRSQFGGEKDADVRRAIAGALGKLGDRDALDMLIAAFRDPRTEPPVRSATIEAVEAIGSEKAVKSLGDLIAGRTLPADLRLRAIAALGHLEDPAAVAPLLTTLKAPEPVVRAAGVNALLAIAEARRSEDTRRRPRRSGPPARTSQRNDVARAVRPLLTDADVSVRHRAIAVARSLEDREAIPGLLAAADTPDSRFEAAMALAAVPDVRALSVYLRGLADKNTGLREASAAAIGRDPRPGGAGARPARRPPRALAVALAGAAEDLRRPHADQFVAGRRPVPDRRRSGDQAGCPDRPEGQLRTRGRQACDMADRQPADARGHVNLRRIYTDRDDRRPTVTPRSTAPTTGRRRWPSAPTTR